MVQHRCGDTTRRLPIIALAVFVLSLRAFAQPGSALILSSATPASPAPERVAAGDAWRLAESIAVATPDCELLVGSGDSMLPLYPDRTLLIVRRISMMELQRGMTVVFIGDRGRPVAHVLLEKTPRGWLAQGLGNARVDRTLVRARNYIGTVVRAFTPVFGMDANVATVPGEPAPVGQ